MTTNNYDYDYLIIGSGFGGSVSACRLTEKGYSVAVMEMGRRWKAEDFAKKIMAQANVPTAKSFTCTNQTQIEAALDFFEKDISFLS